MKLRVYILKYTISVEAELGDYADVYELSGKEEKLAHRICGRVRRINLRRIKVAARDYLKNSLKSEVIA